MLKKEGGLDEAAAEKEKGGVAMKRKTVIALRRKKKYGALMGPFFGIKDVKEAEDGGRG